MEELRSTEVLAREILEDAHKKAQKLLKHADETSEAQARESEKRTRDAIDTARKNYGEKTKKDSEGILSRLPLDKRRLRSEFAVKNLADAMDGFLRSLPRETLLSVLERELEALIKTCKDDISIHEAGICYSGLSLSEIRELLKKLSMKGNFDFREDPHSHEFPWVVIETQAVKISASVENAAAALLKFHRAELAAALLGEGVLND